MLILLFIASRAKMSTRNAISKIRGQEQKILYPQPEGTLGDYMVKHGTDLGEDSLFGQLVFTLSIMRYHLTIMFHYQCVGKYH